jgi:hypothetical protein
MATTLVSESITKYVKAEDGVEFTPSFVVDGDKLAAMSDDNLFKVYRSCKAARAARIIIFYELQRRGKVGGKTVDGVPALNRFFADHGLNYDTEYKFVYREKQAIEAELLAASNPKPVPDLAVAEAGDEEATEREDIEVKEPTTITTTPETPKPACKKCVKLEAKITKLEEEKAALIEIHKKKVEELKKSLEDLRAETKRKIAELKGKKQDTAAAKLDTKPQGGTRIDDTSEPVNGFYWKFRKAAKPYGIFNTDTAMYGTAALCECNNEQDAVMKIREYANELTKTAKA